MGGVCRGSQGLSLCLSPFLPSLIALFKVPKKSSICGASRVCDRGVKVAGMPFSPCLSPSQLVCLPVPHPLCQQAQPDLPHGFYLSVSRWVLMLPPSDVVLSTSRVLLWAILGGFMVGPDLPLISYRSILKQETQPERLSLCPPLLSLYFYFGAEVKQWRLCAA